MKTAVSLSPTESLQTVMSLAQRDPQAAQAEFETLHQTLERQSPQAADLVALLWREYLTAQRSARFWQELCQVEKHLSERLSESHLQLKQNYQRLMQEQ